MNEGTMTRYYLSIGTNTEPIYHLQRILERLHHPPAWTLHAVSSVYVSADAKGGNRLYHNMAVMVRSQHSPEAFKREMLQAIERDLGRVKGSAEVVADLDIVLIDERVMTYLGRTIPDPAVLEQAFVLVPLAEIAPDYFHPLEQRTLAEVRQGFEAHKLATLSKLQPQPNLYPSQWDSP